MENEEQDVSDYSSNGSEPQEEITMEVAVKGKSKKQEELEKKERNLKRLEALKKAREVKRKLAEERRLFKEQSAPKAQKALKELKTPIVEESEEIIEPKTPKPKKALKAQKEQKEPEIEPEESVEEEETEVVPEIPPKKTRNVGTKGTKGTESTPKVPKERFGVNYWKNSDKEIAKSEEKKNVEKIVYILNQPPKKEEKVKEYYINSTDELPIEMQKYIPRETKTKKPGRKPRINYDEQDKYETIDPEIARVGRIIFD